MQVRVSCEFSLPLFSVLVKYSGYLEHMDKPFDSNCFRKTPRLMKLGEGKFTLGAGKDGTQCFSTGKQSKAQVLRVGFSETRF